MADGTNSRAREIVDAADRARLPEADQDLVLRAARAADHVARLTAAGDDREAALWRRYLVRVLALLGLPLDLVD